MSKQIHTVLCPTGAPGAGYRSESFDDFQVARARLREIYEQEWKGRKGSKDRPYMVSRDVAE